MASLVIDIVKSMFFVISETFFGMPNMSHVPAVLNYGNHCSMLCKMLGSRASNTYPNRVDIVLEKCAHLTFIID